MFNEAKELKLDYGFLITNQNSLNVYVPPTVLARMLRGLQQNYFYD